MVWVIRREIVTRALQRLRAQKTHTLFSGYLHLQQQAGIRGRLDNLQPEFLQFFERFFKVSGHPLGTPYIKPFERSPSPKNLWLNKNVAGTYAPSSLRPDQPFRKVVSINEGTYSLFEDHALKARHHLLSEQIQVADLAVFLYRDYGIDCPYPSIQNLIDIFAYEFGYATVEGEEPNEDFEILYSPKTALSWEDEWVDPFDESKL